ASHVEKVPCSRLGFKESDKPDFLVYVAPMKTRRPNIWKGVAGRHRSTEVGQTAIQERIIPESRKPRFSPRNSWVVIFLIGINLLAYAPVRHYGYVNFDDPQYIIQNPQVTGGLTWHAIGWAFTTGYQANWHPVTWLSHML